MDQHYEKLEELIKDEDKIVTIPSFAWETKLSNNDALSVINKFVQCHKESGEIYVTYVLVGKKKDDEKLSVLMVRGEQLEEAKELFQDGVDMSLFSIQKAKRIDYNVIALIDSQINYNDGIILGSIIGKNCSKRILQKKQLPTLPTPTIRGKSRFFTKQNKEEKVAVKEENEPKLSDNKNKPTQQNPISNMFSKANQNNKVEHKGEKPNNTNKDGKKNTIMNFFSNQAHNNKIKTEQKKLVNKEPIKVGKLSSIIDSDTDEEILKDIDMNVETEPEQAPVQNKKPVVKENNKNPKKRQAKTSGNSSKKRRRIIVENNSDSDIFASDKSEDEDIIDKSDEEPEPVKPVQLPSKARKRKPVERMYEEEGYIVTKTEYVYETASEDESEPVKTEMKPKLAKSTSSTETEVSPNKGGKKANKKTKGKQAMASNQTSLKNFFKPK